MGVDWESVPIVGGSRPQGRKPRVGEGNEWSGEVRNRMSTDSKKGETKSLKLCLLGFFHH